MTAFPQNTIGQILDSERAMVLTAPERFGEHYVVAQDCVLFRDAVLEVVGR